MILLTQVLPFTHISNLGRWAREVCTHNACRLQTRVECPEVVPLGLRGLEEPPPRGGEQGALDGPALLKVLGVSWPGRGAFGFTR